MGVSEMKPTIPFFDPATVGLQGQREPLRVWLRILCNRRTKPDKTCAKGEVE
ncbi:MAG: hypothetical protein GXP27_04765 [Planctomycetes bacterium]|nr:hypothetical protein [Planctomycetota bacterium]